MMKFVTAFTVLLLINSIQAYSQEARIYFDKIAQISIQNKNINVVFKKLDSLEQTRMPSRSFIRKTFDRNIDFGFKHQRIEIQLNFINYQIDFLVKNDSTFLVSVFSGQTNDYRSKNKINLDTVATASYLSKRNTFYISKKSIDDLISDLNVTVTYAFYCGEANSKTEDGRKIENLVYRKNINALKSKLESITCETKAYGVAGFKMLIKKGIKIPNDDLKLIKYIEKRNSDLLICSGCFSGILSKIYKQND